MAVCAGGDLKVRIKSFFSPSRTEMQDNLEGDKYIHPSGSRADELPMCQPLAAVRVGSSGSFRLTQREDYEAAIAGIPGTW